MLKTYQSLNESFRTINSIFIKKMFDSSNIYTINNDKTNKDVGE
ncbi:hypothetical protein [Mycoplasma bradburyae]|nr:hypothetical protein [Mycoplasma bradburyae]